jgi:hypothetical protein
LSLDGNNESKDSEPIKLSKNLMIQLNNAAQELDSQLKPKKPQTLMPPNNQQLQNQASSNEANRYEYASAASHSNIKKQPNIPGQMMNNNNKPEPVPIMTQPQQLLQQQATAASTPIKPKIPLVGPAKVSNANGNRSAINNQTKNSIETDADLYENNRSVGGSSQQQKTLNKPMTGAIAGPVIKQQGTINSKTTNMSGGGMITTNRLGSPNSSQIQDMSSLPKQKSIKDDSYNPAQLSATTPSKSKKNFKVFIALFDYDPFKMSPNQDSCEEELPFKEGQLIKVYGEPDADGYYYGEANGRSGYIPGNMVSEVDDPDVIKQLMNAQQDSYDSSSEKQKRKSNSKTNQSTGGGGGGGSSSSSKQKPSSKSSSNSKMKEQSSSSFMPINNYNNNSSHYKSNSSVNQNVRNMIALYDYDPQSLSPNADTDVSSFFCEKKRFCKKVNNF